MSRKNISYVKGYEHSDFTDLLNELQGKKENIEMARRGGKIANNARVDLEREIGEKVITNNNNNLNYKYISDKKIENK